MDIGDNRNWLSDCEECKVTVVTEIDWATGSIYSGDPRVDRSHLISSLHKEIHTFTFPAFDLTYSFWDFIYLHNCMASHGQVVLHNLTHFLCSWSQNSSFSLMPFGCCERCCGVLMIGSLPSASVVLPHFTERSQVLQGAAECHFINQVNSGIWQLWGSGLTTSKHSQMLQVTKIHSADVKNYIYILLPT